MTCSSSTTFTRKLLLAAAATLLLGAARSPADEAAAALARGDGVSAEVAVRMAIKAGAKPDTLRALLGEALLLEGNRPEARKWLTEGRFAPGSEGRGWRARGRLELAEGNLVAAAQAFDLALKANPRDPLLWVDIARLRYTGGEQAGAWDAASRALAISPRNVRALEFKGLLVRERFGLVASLPWFEAGLKLAPEDKALLGEYAATLGEMGNYRDMLVVCRKLTEVDPGNVRALYLQAVLAARAGKNQLARSILLKTGGALRDVPAAMLLNGVLEYRAGNLNLAIEQLDRLLRIQPDNREAGELLARALSRAGNDRLVIQRYAVLADRPGASPYLLELVARSLDQVKRHREAGLLRARIEAAADAPFVPIPAGAPLGVLAVRFGDDPAHGAATAIPYIRALLAAGQGGNALAVAIALRDRNPGASEAHILVGDVRMVTGDPAGAVADWRRASAIRLTAPLVQRLVTGLRETGQGVLADRTAAGFFNQNPQSPVARRLAGL